MLGFGLFLPVAIGCEDVGKRSAEAAHADLPFLLEAVRRDVEDVRSGLPQGAIYIQKLFEQAKPEIPGFEAASDALARARDRTQDLRVAKSTFFAVTRGDGSIIRNDQKQDLMAGKNLFEFFPALRGAQGYMESRGVMPEAAGVNGRPDGQWVAALPIAVGGETQGLYVTGWSWSSYAYRLETGLRSDILSRAKEGDKIPLIYVYLVVEDEVYGAPIAPRVNGEAVLELVPFERLGSATSFAESREIQGRKFGIAVGHAEALGERVAIAIVRSET